MTRTAVSLRHGYTTTDLDALTRTAVHADRSRALPYADAWDAAWSAIAAALYETAAPPSRHDLITAGWKAIYAEVRADRRQYGYAGREAAAGWDRRQGSPGTGAPTPRRGSKAWSSGSPPGRSTPQCLTGTGSCWTRWPCSVTTGPPPRRWACG